MKKVIFLFCEEAFWGYLSPVSNLTELNLERAISLLQCGQSDFLYIAIDHFSEKKKNDSRHYFDEFFNDFYPELVNRVYISSSSMPYAKMFANYLSLFGAEMHCSILARINRKREISHQINDANLQNEQIRKPIFLNA